jgi:hypothetical protein
MQGKPSDAEPALTLIAPVIVESKPFIEAGASSSADTLVLSELQDFSTSLVCQIANLQARHITE